MENLLLILLQVPDLTEFPKYGVFGVIAMLVLIILTQQMYMYKISNDSKKTIELLTKMITILEMTKR